MNINWIKMIDDPSLPVPTRHYASDAGVDLFAAETIIIEPAQASFVPVGWRIDMPFNDDVFAWNTSPSGISRRLLLVLPGIIDPGYAGDCGPIVFNLGKKPVTLNKYEKVSHLLLLHRAHVEFGVVQESPFILRQSKDWGTING